MKRSEVQPILEAIPAARQEDARHYGVHPYFTRRPANVVRAYIERYSQPGDLVLDPFGGTGVTAIEAMLMGRKAVHNDLNPFANFIAENIADTSLPSTMPLRDGFSRVEKRCKKQVNEIESEAQPEVAKWRKRISLPKIFACPKTPTRNCFLICLPRAN